MTAGDLLGVRKARGAFFTPESLCRFVAAWAIERADCSVLEPSLGEAAFLLAAGERLRELGGPVVPGQLAGVELHEASVREARRLLTAQGHTADLRTANFFSVGPEPVYDAVVGNPPYVRYQDFAGADRALAQAAALRAGVRISSLASSWAAFTVHASLFLKPEGRLGLVLPAELLSVNYASEVRSFLMRRFARVRIVMFTDRVFPGVLEEVVLLLADGDGPTDHCELVQVRNVEDLTGPFLPHEASRWTPRDTADKWTDALAPREAIATLRHLTSTSFVHLSTWGETTLGMVTGANKYFALSPDRVAELGLTEADVVPISPPGSRHLRALVLDEPGRLGLGTVGASTMLFRPAGEPSPAGRRYIASGEASGVDTAYKCRIRKPWWRVPLLKPADLFLTYMNADTPRLCTNAAAVHHLNSLHGVYLHADVRALGTALLPLASLNSATAFAAEIVGRSYGGGMLKIEPREADRLPVPSYEQLRAAEPSLLSIREQVISCLRRGDTAAAVDLVDQAILVGACQLVTSQVQALQKGLSQLRTRRAARNSEPRSPRP